MDEMVKPQRGKQRPCDLYWSGCIDGTQSFKLALRSEVTVK